MSEFIQTLGYVLLGFAILCVLLEMGTLYYSAKFRLVSAIVFGLSAICNLLLLFFAWDFTLFCVTVMCAVFCFIDLKAAKQLSQK